MAATLEQYVAEATNAYKPSTSAIQSQLDSLSGRLDATNESINRDYAQQQANLNLASNQAAEAASMSAAGNGGSFGGAGNLARRKYYEQSFVPAVTQLQTNRANDLLAAREANENTRNTLNQQLANLQSQAANQGVQQYYADTEAEAGRTFQAGEAQKTRDYQAEQAQLSRDFEASQSEITRQFQAEQSSLDRQFNEAQAQLNREWEDYLADKRYKNEAVEAEKVRQFQAEQAELERQYNAEQARLNREFEAAQNAASRAIQQRQIDAQNVSRYYDDGYGNSGVKTWDFGNGYRIYDNGGEAVYYRNNTPLTRGEFLQGTGGNGVNWNLWNDIWDSGTRTNGVGSDTIAAISGLSGTNAARYKNSNQYGYLWS